MNRNSELGDTSRASGAARRKMAIGVDYGTESGRAIVVDVETGEELAAHVTPYAHASASTLLRARCCR